MSGDMFLRCPVCHDTAVVRLVEDWQAKVDAGGAIPIVGNVGTCGNPWHYEHIVGGLPDPTAGTCQSCAEVVHDADCPRVGDGRPVEGHVKHDDWSCECGAAITADGAHYGLRP
jgi:hypothetical protein